MLYIVLAYLMLFAALSNDICLYNASLLQVISAIAFILIFCLGLLTHSLFISRINLHHANFLLMIVFCIEISVIKMTK